MKEIKWQENILDLKFKGCASSTASVDHTLSFDIFLLEIIITLKLIMEPCPDFFLSIIVYINNAINLEHTWEHQTSLFYSCFWRQNLLD